MTGAVRGQHGKSVQTLFSTVDNLTVSIARFELILFFSGYALVYCFVHVLSPSAPVGASGSFLSRLRAVSPYVYASLGTLYLGLECRALFPDYSLTHIHLIFKDYYPKIWGISAVLFWLP